MGRPSTLTLCTSASTISSVCLSVLQALLCACQFPVSTRSRVLAMSLQDVGLNIKGLDKNNMPRSGDVMVYKKDSTLGQTKEFAAQIQVLDIPNEIKVGYSPIGFVRCGRSACRISKLT